MERANDRVLNALSALQINPDWVTVKEWIIETQKAETKTMLMTKDEAQLRWLQGSLQTLGEIIDLSDKAMAVLFSKKK